VVEHPDLAQLAAVVGAAGAMVVLVTRTRQAILAGFALLVAAEAGLAGALVPSKDLKLVVESPVRAAAVAAALGVVAGLGYLFVRNPPLGTMLLAVAAPFRLPLEIGSQRAFLLVPLYCALAGVGVAFVYRLVRGGDPPGLPPLIAWPAAAFIALSGVSLVWSQDLRAGSIELAFFLFPFAALVCVVGRTPIPNWLPRALAVVVVSLGAIFAAIGLWQWKTERLFFARDLEVANAYTTYFRVTSVFKDPSIYGRQLVVAIGVLLVALWLRRVSGWLAAGLIAFLFGGLFFSYSQSSYIALFAVTAAVSVATGGRLARRLAAGIFVALALFGVGFLLAIWRSGDSQRFTSGRSSLVTNTAKVFREHPLAGVGVGSQPVASRELAERRLPTERNASHTTPLTVAAELGVLGIAAYLAFLAGALAVVAAAYAREQGLGLALGTVLLALFVHSLFYSGFFEDPLTWGALGVAAAAVLAPARQAALPWPLRRIERWLPLAGLEPAPAPAARRRVLAHWSLWRRS
jgi:O-antigen ligase/polysaccharide polymerase Wzy-like membrane protein